MSHSELRGFKNKIEFLIEFLKVIIKAFKMLVTGAIVGISIGCFIFGCCCASCCIYYWDKYAGMLAPR